MPESITATAVGAALALEGIAPDVRRRILNRLTHGEPTDPGHRCTRLQENRMVAQSLLGFGPPNGELLGQTAAAMLRELWSAPGVETVSRFWLEWNVVPPPGELPATLMQLAAQIDFDEAAASPQDAAPSPLPVHWPGIGGRP